MQSSFATALTKQEGPNVWLRCTVFWFFFSFLSAACCKKRIQKTSILTKIFGPSYFVRALEVVGLTILRDISWNRGRVKNKNSEKTFWRLALAPLGTIHILRCMFFGLFDPPTYHCTCKGIFSMKSKRNLPCLCLPCT